MNTKHLTKGIVVILLLFITSSIYAQTYREIKGWSKEINERIETFLNTTLTMNIRKVAVFDGDGTVIGQAPHYLADEALYRYADKYYKGKNDKYCEYSKEIEVTESRTNVSFYFNEQDIVYKIRISKPEIY